MTTPPLWRQMHIAATAATLSFDRPSHRYAAILNIVAGYLNKHGHQEAAFLLLGEADTANGRER